MPKFHVERSIEVEASPEKVFEVVSDYSTWTTWSPWLCAEPDAAVTISDDSSSIGSTYAWEGEITGAGELEHLQLTPGRRIEDEIRFFKPFKSVSNVTFEMEPVGENTKLSWHMNGSMPWFLFWMIPRMQTFIGMDYERGLKMLKEWIETGKIESQTAIIGVESVGPMKVLGMRKTCSFDGIGESMRETFNLVAEKLSEANVQITGDPVSIYHKMNTKAKTFEYTSGFIVSPSTDSIPDDLTEWSIPKIQALRTDHIGRYDHLGNSWSAANHYAHHKKLKQSKVGAFEIYRNDCNETDPSDLETVIYLPLKA